MGRARSACARPGLHSIRRDEAPCAVLVEHESRDGSDHLRVAYQREPAVVQDQPPPVHTRRHGRTIFVLQRDSEDYDLYI